MPSDNKKPTFGTLSVVTVFFVTFIIVMAILFGILIAIRQLFPDSRSGVFGPEIIFALLLVPALIVATIISGVSAAITANEFRSQITPDNRTSSMVLWGVIALIPGWTIIAFFCLDGDRRVGSPNPKILVPVISGILQLIVFVFMGLLAKSTDGIRRKVWGPLLCITILIIPIIVLRIVVR